MIASDRRGHVANVIPVHILCHILLRPGPLLGKDDISTALLQNPVPFLLEMDLRWSHNSAHPMEHLPNLRILPTMYPHGSHLEPNHRGEVRSESTRSYICSSWNQHLYRSSCCYFAIACNMETQPSAFSEDCTFWIIRSRLFVSHEFSRYHLC